MDLYASGLEGNAQLRKKTKWTEFSSQMDWLCRRSNPSLLLKLQLAIKRRTLQIRGTANANLDNSVKHEFCVTRILEQDFLQLLYQIIRLIGAPTTSGALQQFDRQPAEAGRGRTKARDASEEKLTTHRRQLCRWNGSGRFPIPLSRARPSALQSPLCVSRRIRTSRCSRSCRLSVEIAAKER